MYSKVIIIYYRFFILPLLFSAVYRIQWEGFSGILMGTCDRYYFELN